MANKCPTFSQSGIERSNPQGEARGGEPASRNQKCKLVSASLHKVKAGNLPRRTKPAVASEAAWKRVGKKGKASGIDGVKAEDILAEENGVKKFLTNLHEELKTKSYHPSPVKRVYSRKPTAANGP